MILSSILRTDPILWPLLIVLAAIYIIPRTPIHEKVEQKMYEHYEKLPEVRIDFHPSRTFRNRFSTNRTALYIETRDDTTFSTPLLLHMTKVVPPEWRFLFIGTPHLLGRMSQSASVRGMVESGKLRLVNAERWTNTWKDKTDIHETHSRLLTNMTFYDEQLPGVEWLLTFRSSGIICASANRTVNHYLDYDWVGAPWKKDDSFGGNGGLSLRRLSKVRQVLKFQARTENHESEDTWMSRRLGLLPGANCANASIEQGFAVEDIWADRPLGYHLNPNLAPGHSPDVWDGREKREKIYSYCPEIKMIMKMRLERERCPPPPPEQPKSKSDEELRAEKAKQEEIDRKVQETRKQDEARKAEEAKKAEAAQKAEEAMKAAPTEPKAAAKDDTAQKGAPESNGGYQRAPLQSPDKGKADPLKAPSLSKAQVKSNDELLTDLLEDSQEGEAQESNAAEDSDVDAPTVLTGEPVLNGR